MAEAPTTPKRGVGTLPSLPPGAMQPGNPGSAPPIPSRPPNGYTNMSYSGLPSHYRTTSGDFGGARRPLPQPGSMSSRTLPTPPGVGASGQTTPSQPPSSVQPRRALPTPPGSGGLPSSPYPPHLRSASSSSSPRPVDQPSPPVSRRESDRLQSPAPISESPVLISDASSGPSSSSSYVYFPPAADDVSRHSSSGSGPSTSLAHSSSRSSALSSAYDPYAANDTRPTSTSTSTHGPAYDWQPELQKLDELDGGGGTSITLMPPGSPIHSDGRRTPTGPAPVPSSGSEYVPTRTLNTSRSFMAGALSDRTPSHSRNTSLDFRDPSSVPPPPPPKDYPPSSSPTSRLSRPSVEFPSPSPHLAIPSSTNTTTRHSSSSASLRSDATTPAPSQPTSASFPSPHPAPVQRHTSTDTSSTRPSAHPSRSSDLSPSWASQNQQPSSWVQTKLQIHQSHADYDDDEYYDDDDFYASGSRRLSWEEGDEQGVGDAGHGSGGEDGMDVEADRFFQRAFLSEMALRLRDRVPKRRQMKAGIAWVGAFTGRDVVSTIQECLPSYTRLSSVDRRCALIMARSLQNQLWFVEVDWDVKPLRDSPEDVFRFMGEMEGMGSEGLTAELPTGLMTMATRCYSPSCTGDSRCYAARCPFKTSPDAFLGQQATPLPTPSSAHQSNWTETVDPLLLHNLSEREYQRQAIIRQAIQSEIQYETDLTALQKLYIDGLRTANPPIIHPSRLPSFIEEVFGNIRDVHENCKRLIDDFAIKERESAQRPLITSVGGVFLEAAVAFREIYPDYTGNLPNAENVLKKELDENSDFRLYCERIVRENDRRQDIKLLIARPSTQLQRYPAVIEAILNATDERDPDRDFLQEALTSIQSISALSQLKLFHASRGRGPAGKMEWHNLVSEEVRNGMEKKEQKRQMQIWELIQGEMEYVADLDTIDKVLVGGLREADEKPIIERGRLETFLDDAFHNYRSLLEVHEDLLEKLQHRQLEQHPSFGMISDLILDAALNWRDAYMEYVTHYPIAEAKVAEEKARNPEFVRFLQLCLRDPRSNRQDIKHFIHRPVARLLRYPLLLSGILASLKEVDPMHPDVETIPQVIEIIGDLSKATQKGVAVNEAKVELWTYQYSLDGARFGQRAVKDLDLANAMRELIHRGKVFRQPEGTISGGWTELLVLLFDNYLVLAKPEKSSKNRKEDRQVRYAINRRPIPLELLSLGNFSEQPRARKDKLFSVGGGSHQDSTDPRDESATTDRNAWPFTISFIGQGQLGGQYTLWTDTYAARAEWQEKLQHAKVLRTEVNDANKVFEMTPISYDTFYMAPNYTQPKADGESPWTGRVTCSVPFTTIDRRMLVAVGCESGVWIGLRNDPKSLRKVLHVKLVTQIAVLEEFGVFLVLQDKNLLAYLLEALVPSATSPRDLRAAPQRIGAGKDVVFFQVGQLNGRTLLIYMLRKGIDSFFRVLEPVVGRNNEDLRQQRRPFGGLLAPRSEWFRQFKEFFVPTEALHVQFLRHKIVITCGKGFEIMDLSDLKGGSVPIFDAAKVSKSPTLLELQKRCEAARPLGMYRSTNEEFLLCYDSFGMYIDRYGEPKAGMEAIEWEGRPDSVAFHPPYILLISAPFIEIRHISTAKLLQIYTGTDMRLTWDGTGGMAKPFIDNPGPSGYGDETTTQEPRIHICRRPEDARRARGPSGGIGQHVFELTPTLKLNDPLSNPVHTLDSNYFPPAPPVLSQRPSSIGSRLPYQVDLQEEAARQRAEQQLMLQQQQQQQQYQPAPRQQEQWNDPAAYGDSRHSWATYDAWQQQQQQQQQRPRPQQQQQQLQPNGYGMAGNNGYEWGAGAGGGAEGVHRQASWSTGTGTTTDGRWDSRGSN